MLITSTKKALPDFLYGGGEMGERIHHFDWNETPLGNIEQWSQSLKATIAIMMNSPFPMLLWWGKEYISIYNNAYIPILGTKHPWGLGKPVKECWSEIWDILQPLIDTPFNGGPATWMDDIALQINRNNFFEETHFTIAYSPVPDSEAPNRIGGVLATVNEISQQVINERSMDTLNKLSTYTINCKTRQEVFEKAALALSENQYDFPFTLFYEIKHDTNEARLCSSSVISLAEIRKFEKIDLTNEDPWNIGKVVRHNEAVILEDLKARFGKLPTGKWSQPPSLARIIPVNLKGKIQPFAIFISALNPFRKFDDKYQNFLRLLTEQLEQALLNVNIIEEERKRSESLAELDRAKTSFFTNISHEFRTPITLMLGPLEEFLNKSNISGSEKQSIETTHKNALRLLKLVNALLDFSRIESGRQQAKYTLTDIASYTTSLASNFRSVIETAGLKFFINTGTVKQDVYVDRQMWEKIVFNLLSNAFKYTINGSICLSVTSNGRDAVLTVEDTGIGIPENDLPHMFERFHRAGNTAGRTYEGTGIGLSLIKEMIQLHGGSVSVSSVQGKGSSFTVTIPVGKDHLPQSLVEESVTNFENPTSDLYILEAASLLAPNEPITSLDTDERKIENAGRENAKTGGTVLVVDDNADMRQYIRRLLSVKYEVIDAENGMEALQKIRKHPPSLVLCDIMMPLMDGIQLLKEIKQDPQTQNIPVVLLTARAGEESKIEGYEIGADDYLVKPFSAKELVARIDAQIKINKRRDQALQSIYNLFNEVPFAVAVLKGESLIIEYINRYNLNIWKQEKEEVLGKPLYEARPDLRTDTEIIHKEVFTTGKRFKASEIPVKLTMNGKTETRYFDTVIDPMLDENKNIIGQLATSIEVTDEVIARKKIEESEHELRQLAESLEQKVKDRTQTLQQRNQFIETIFNSSIDIMAVLDKDLNYVALNKPAFAQYGVRTEDVIGKNIVDLYPHIKTTGMLENINKAFQGETIHDPKYWSQSVSRWFENFYIPLQNDSGEVYNVLLIGHDITASIEAEKMLQEKNKELEMINNELESFNYIASHDLQEPLRKIKTFADRILHSKDMHFTPATQDYFNRLVNAANRMQKLIESLLGYSLTSVDNKNFHETNLNEILNEVRQNLHDIIEEKNAIIESEELPVLNVVPIQFQQLFSNLISNAIKYSKPDVRPEIKITAGLIEADHIKAQKKIPGNKYWRISFKDNGIGFEPQYEEKIFELFQRLHGRQEYSGTGVGLAICKKIVENHHGVITASGKLGTGATFNIYLPS